jgi:phosphopentomutase
VGRVIARPFTGEPGAFVRRPERRDFSVPPPGPTLLDRCIEHGVAVYGVGKIQDIFAQQGLTEARYSDSNDHGRRPHDRVPASPRSGARVRQPRRLRQQVRASQRPARVRPRDRGARRADPELVGALGGGVLLLTGDHGCDPTTPSTDHSRERTPLLAAGLEGGPYDVGDRDTYADLGATVAELLEVPWDLEGSSFAGEIGR